jgi:hypothetical protein
VSHEMGNVAGAETVESVEGNTCALVMQEASSRRGRGPHHVQKDRVGSWETSSCPQPPLAVPGHGRKPKKAKLPRKRRGVGRPHSTRETPNKAGCNWWRRWWREGGRSRGVGDDKRRPGHSTGPTSPMRRHHRCRNWMGRPSPERRCRGLSTRAGCGKDARPDPCGGRGVTHVPTATVRKAGSCPRSAQVLSCYTGRIAWKPWRSSHRKAAAGKARSRFTWPYARRCTGSASRSSTLIDTHYVDTGGTSDHVFILCTMLGFRSVRSLPTRCRNFLHIPRPWILP